MADRNPLEKPPAPAAFFRFSTGNLTQAYINPAQIIVVEECFGDESGPCHRLVVRSTHGHIFHISEHADVIRFREFLQSLTP